MDFAVPFLLGFAFGAAVTFTACAVWAWRAMRPNGRKP